MIFWRLTSSIPRGKYHSQKICNQLKAKLLKMWLYHEIKNIPKKRYLGGRGNLNATCDFNSCSFSVEIHLNVSRDIGRIFKCLTMAICRTFFGV